MGYNLADTFTKGSRKCDFMKLKKHIFSFSKSAIFCKWEGGGNLF